MTLVQQIDVPRRREGLFGRGPWRSQEPTRGRAIRKPRRWDTPFGAVPVPAHIVGHVLSLPDFRSIDPREFPEDLALADIIAHDGRILDLARGDVVFRQGEFGTSLFIVLSGSVTRMTTPRGRQTRPGGQAGNGSVYRAGFDGLKKRLNMFLSVDAGRSSIEEIDDPAAISASIAMGRDEIFGLSEALTRGPRRDTVIAGDDDTALFELRLPGLRELRQWSDVFCTNTDRLYGQRGLWNGLISACLFDNVDLETLRVIARHSRFETHGSFNWTHGYQRESSDRQGAARIIEQEPVIALQDHYLDDLLVIHSGFARVSENLDHGEKTIGYLSGGDVFGLDEITQSQRGDGDRISRRSLRAAGYTDIIRIPTQIVEEYLLPALPQELKQFTGVHGAVGTDGGCTTGTNKSSRQSMLDFSIDNRFINGSHAMVINLDACVNCDDCVRACAATHDNIPRFIRQGVSHKKLMIANACMHCVDPVCLIDCPTGAIHREADTGCVVIDDATCVGCTACATACPYNNIRMEELRDTNGAILNDLGGEPVLRATKCDFCSGQLGGPACQRACPHDALIRIDIRDTDQLSAWMELSQ